LKKKKDQEAAVDKKDGSKERRSPSAAQSRDRRWGEDIDWFIEGRFDTPKSPTQKNREGEGESNPKGR